MKVLVADDDGVSRMLISHWLTSWGYDVVGAEDGQAAQRILASTPDIRMVLADWVMPGMDGPDLCRFIRSRSQSQYVYVVLVTSRGARDDVVSGLDAGADDYVTKPVNPAELELRLRAAGRMLELEDELRAVQERLRFEAMHDPLTSLLNRAAILERLDEELSRASRKHAPLSALMIDVDRFKHVNDTLGHATGDTVLCGVAERLRLGVRTYDPVARFGGEEFLVVLADCDLEQAERVAERARRSLCRRPIQTSEGDLEITASFGVATTGPAQFCLGKDLLRAADMAMYRAKAEGRNRVVTAASLDPYPLSAQVG
ncbi:MAG: diguanylate cyclase [Myxococcales bacterium]|nr:diguanylate cyclase [Myxococcales bacterium]MCB9579062.1 diguanylate cyclase [Polyangiaceae bacterium]